MSELTKYRINFKKRSIILLILFICFFIMFLLQSNLISNLFASTEPQEDILTEAQGIAMKNEMIHGSLNMHIEQITSVLVGINFLSIIIIGFLSISFFREKQNLFAYRYTRNENQKHIVLSSIFSYSFINALMFYFAYIIMFTILYLFLSNPSIQPGTLKYFTFFDPAFGKGFSGKNVYVHYILEGIYTSFLSSLIFSILSCSITLICKKVYQAILLPIIAFLSASILSVLAFGGKRVLEWLNPSFIYSFNSSRSWKPEIVSLFLPFLCFVIPLVISFICILCFLNKKEKI